MIAFPFSFGKRASRTNVNIWSNVSIATTASIAKGYLFDSSLAFPAHALKPIPCCSEPVVYMQVDLYVRTAQHRVHTKNGPRGPWEGRVQVREESCKNTPSKTQTQNQGSLCLSPCGLILQEFHSLESLGIHVAWFDLAKLADAWFD